MKTARPTSGLADRQRLEAMAGCYRPSAAANKRLLGAARRGRGGVVGGAVWPERLSAFRTRLERTSAAFFSAVSALCLAALVLPRCRFLTS